MSKIDFSNLQAPSKKRVDTTEIDDIFLNFLAKHKYADEVSANII